MKIPGSVPPAARVLTRTSDVAALSTVRRSDGPTGAAASGPSDRPTVGSSDALRSVLTDEERAYFDQIAQLGPISYAPGRRSSPVPEAPRGLRLDVTG
jgi:guanyl-specific ribonuclease Sa